MNPILQILKDLLAAVVKGVGADLTKNAPEVGQSGSRAPSPPPVRKAPASPDKSPPSDPDDDFSWASRSTRKAFARNVAAFNQRKEESERKKPAPWLPSSMAAGVREAFSLASRDLKNRLWGKGRQRSATEQFSESTAKVAEKRPEPPPEVTPEESAPKAPQEKPPYHPASIVSGVKEAFSLVFGSRRRQSEISSSPKKASRIDHVKQRQAILADMERNRKDPEPEAEQPEESKGQTQTPSPQQGGFLRKFFSGGLQKYRARSLAGGKAGTAQPGNQLNPGGGSVNYGQLMTMMGKPQGEVNKARQEMLNPTQQKEEKSGGLFTRLTRSLGSLIGRVATFGAAIYGVYKSLQLFGSVTLESRRNLAEFNGQISAAFTRLRVQEIQQNIQMGRATRNSTTALAESMRELRDTTQESRQAFTSILNGLAIVSLKAANAIAAIYKQIDLLIPIAQLIEGNTKKDKDETLPLMKLLDDLRTGRNQNVPTLPRL